MTRFTPTACALAVWIAATAGGTPARAESHQQAVAIDVLSAMPFALIYDETNGFRMAPNPIAIDLGYHRAIIDRFSVSGGLAFSPGSDQTGPAFMARAAGRFYAWSRAPLEGAFVEAGARVIVGSGVSMGNVWGLGSVGYSQIFELLVPLYTGASVGLAYGSGGAGAFPTAGLDLGVAF